MFNSKLVSVALISLLSVTFTSCDKDDDDSNSAPARKLTSIQTFDADNKPYSTTTFTYDGEGRIVEKETIYAEELPMTKNTRKTYKYKGDMVEESDGEFTITYQLSSNGLLSSLDYQGPTWVKKLSWEYFNNHCTTYKEYNRFGAEDEPNLLFYDYTYNVTWEDDDLSKYKFTFESPSGKSETTYTYTYADSTGQMYENKGQLAFCLDIIATEIIEPVGMLHGTSSKHLPLRMYTEGSLFRQYDWGLDIEGYPVRLTIENGKTYKFTWE